MDELDAIRGVTPHGELSQSQVRHFLIIQLLLQIGLAILIFFSSPTALSFSSEQIETSLSIPDLVEEYGNAHELTETQKGQILKTLECESSLIPQQSLIIRADGSREESYGIAQIHLPSHPEITKDQAMDNRFAVEFITKEFKAGRANKWTCYRKLFL